MSYLHPKFTQVTQVIHSFLKVIGSIQKTGRIFHSELIKKKRPKISERLMRAMIVSRFLHLTISERPPHKKLGVFLYV